MTLVLNVLIDYGTTITYRIMDLFYQACPEIASLILMLYQKGP